MGAGTNIMFKVGDKVYSVTYGWGEVEDITEPNREYPILVVFSGGDDSYTTYTSDGREYIDLNRDLFFTEISIPQEALVRPANYKTAEIIMTSTITSDNEVESFLPRKFGGFDEDGDVTYLSVYDSNIRLKAKTHMSLREFDEKFNR